jgi:hypothetical protein
VKSKDLRVVIERHRINVFSVGLNSAIWWSIVDSRRRILVHVLEGIALAVLLEAGEQAASVVVIGYSTTVVDVASDEKKGIPWDFILRIQEQLQHCLRSVQIRIIEFVSDVPSEGSELSSLLDNCMEECKSEEELSPDFWLSTIFNILLGEIRITSLQICSKTSGWLCGQLDRVLEDRDGEVVCRH